MQELSKGARLPLAQEAWSSELQVRLAAQGLALDVACFGIDAAGKLVDDRYMTFFNQPATPCGGVTVTRQGNAVDGFRLRLSALPATVERVVVTASIDGGGVMAQLAHGSLGLNGEDGLSARFAFTGQDFAQEQAVMLGEFYRRDGGWRFMAVGQGFNGGLSALVRHFGADVAQDAASQPPPPAPAAPSISLEKRVEAKAPQLVSLVKSAGVSLAKVGLEAHRARVCLVLDISGSMSALYRKGLVQRFAERILALGCRFDDDGDVDVFLFGRNVHQPEPMGLSNWTGYIERAIDKHPLEGDTRYGAAMAAVRRYYFPDAGGSERKTAHAAQLPVYVMFVTDGTTSDQPMTEKQLRWSSREPIFWQFMGIGKGKKSKSKRLLDFADSDFPFLEKLDDLSGRLIDNADFFSVASPDEHSDAALYDLLMTEYPGWVRQAREHGLIR
ncbi:VWA domain-containing protein [Massilia sp. G4R7]|uniref:VWA domain-containing protein n=1 Tax=Massilia phyllostachyos TaxID=2898585 RepID=A0ABS8QB50_9BURK|nr:VWA domain-containing protein [Massilia phyllostachyos]MCD2518985.1 VWA domain-containing protein [Massilia phyllostachyos]